MYQHFEATCSLHLQDRQVLSIQHPARIRYDSFYTGIDPLYSISYSLGPAWGTSASVPFLPAATSTRRRRKDLKKTFVSKEVFRQRYWGKRGTDMEKEVLPPSKLEFFCFLARRKWTMGIVEEEELKRAENMTQGRMQRWGGYGTFIMC